MTDQRGRLLIAASDAPLSHALLRPLPPRALRTWLDSWSGIGHVAVGRARQGYDIQSENGNAEWQVPLTERCWICRRQIEGREAALMSPLLLHLQSQENVRGCSRQCSEFRSDLGVIRAHFYRLECGHYCADHTDHRCCVCRAGQPGLAD
jgi:hypothetical protein